MLGHFFLDAKSMAEMSDFSAPVMHCCALPSIPEPTRDMKIAVQCSTFNPKDAPVDLSLNHIFFSYVRRRRVPMARQKTSCLLPSLCQPWCPDSFTPIHPLRRVNSSPKDSKKLSQERTMLLEQFQYSHHIESATGKPTSPITNQKRFRFDHKKKIGVDFFCCCERAVGLAKVNFQMRMWLSPKRVFDSLRPMAPASESFGTKIWIDWVPLLSAASAYSLIFGKACCKRWNKTSQYSRKSSRNC